MRVKRRFRCRFALVSEGSSTSAREVITILGLAGHHVEICDPAALCLARFSRFVRKFHRCPPLRDASGYLAFVEALLDAGRFDVLPPTHEQGFLFARAAKRLEGRAGLALPAFESYRVAHGKAATFSRLLDELGSPQPLTAIVTSESALRSGLFSLCDQDFHRHREPRHLLRPRLARSRRRRL